MIYSSSGIVLATQYEMEVKQLLEALLKQQMEVQAVLKTRLAGNENSHSIHGSSSKSGVGNCNFGDRVSDSCVGCNLDGSGSCNSDEDVGSVDYSSDNVGISHKQDGGDTESDSGSSNKSCVGNCNSSSSGYESSVGNYSFGNCSSSDSCVGCDNDSVSSYNDVGSVEYSSNNVGIYYEQGDGDTAGHSGSGEKQQRLGLDKSRPQQQLYQAEDNEDGYFSYEKDAVSSAIYNEVGGVIYNDVGSSVDHDNDNVVDNNSGSSSDSGVGCNSDDGGSSSNGVGVDYSSDNDVGISHNQGGGTEYGETLQVRQSKSWRQQQFYQEYENVSGSDDGVSCIDGGDDDHGSYKDVVSGVYYNDNGYVDEGYSSDSEVVGRKIYSVGDNDSGSGDGVRCIISHNDDYGDEGYNSDRDVDSSMIYNEDYGDMGIHHDDCNIGTSYKYGGRGANSNNNSGSSGDGRSQTHTQQQQHTQQQERYPVYDSDGDVGSQMEPGEAEGSSESEDMVDGDRWRDAATSLFIFPTGGV